jgi:Flp pilus assembly protein TadG
MPAVIAKAARGGRSTVTVLCEEGSSLIETALSSSIVLVLIFGIFQMSLALYSYHSICEVAREGSRYAIVRGSTSCVNTSKLTNCNATALQIQTYVKSINVPGLNSAQYMTVSTSWLNGSATMPTTWSNCTVGICNTPGNMVKVQVGFALPLSIPFWRSTVLNLNSVSQMVIAQ